MASWRTRLGICLASFLLFVLPATALASVPVGGYIGHFSPSGRAPSSGNTKFAITSETRYSGAGSADASGGGLYTYRFQCRNKGTKFYLVKVGSSAKRRVSRNTFVHYVLHHHGDLDPVATVTKWTWKSSGGHRYRLAGSIYCNLNR